MFYRKIVLSLLAPCRCGVLEVVLPDGEVMRFGGLGKRCVARLQIRDEDFFRRCVLFGPVGFGESYMEGLWETPDISAVIAFFLLNAGETAALEKPGGRKSPLLGLLAAYNRFLHTRRANTLTMSRENIREHYDLGNDFFRLWLDESLTYSSAYFDPPDLGLGEAQTKKYDVLCRKLRLAPSDHVLEVGTGWGGFAMHAAREYGCRVTTTTISHEQFEGASERIKKAGLTSRITILLEDYRDLSGRFDKIASVEMIEAVGDAYVDGFFAKLGELLAPHGLLGLQAILCPDQQYDVLRGDVDFIQKHIFPGSLLMSNSRILRATSHTPSLNLFAYEDMAAHYAKTLRIWRVNFDAALPEVRALGFDDTFIRKWRYYLSYCEAAFATRFISVAQLIFTKTGNLALNADSPVEDLAFAMPLR